MKSDIVYSYLSCFLLWTITTISVAIINSGRMRNDENSGIIFEEREIRERVIQKKEER